MLRVCSCGTLIPATSRHCSACARLDNQRRNTRTKRDGRNTGAWQKTRARVLARDGHTCQHCGAPGVGVHKIDGGHHTTNTTDYVTLCTPCHGRLHRAEQTMGGVGQKSRNVQPRKPPTNFPREKLEQASISGPFVA
jgi:5-methylcytosine-specific restriction endonuclease McrA